MDERITIGKRGAIHYNECFECGTPKTTRDQRKNKLCNICSSKRNKLADTDTPTKTCKVCKEVFENTFENFHWKDKKKGRLDRTCKACDYNRRKKWATDNPEREKQIRLNEFKRNEPRRLKNPSYRLRRRVSSCIANTMAKRGVSKDHPTWVALPYTPEQLKEHLQAQFDAHMTWDNYGDYWHIDHIHPQSLLPYDSLEHPNFIKCWSLSNLQPLEAIENIKKSNKLLP